MSKFFILFAFILKPKYMAQRSRYLSPLILNGILLLIGFSLISLSTLLRYYLPFFITFSILGAISLKTLLPKFKSFVTFLVILLFISNYTGNRTSLGYELETEPFLWFFWGMSYAAFLMTRVQRQFTWMLFGISIDKYMLGYYIDDNWCCLLYTSPSPRD